MTALGGSWRHRGRSRGASGGLLAFVWSPGTSFSSLFFFPEALCFNVLRHRSRNRHRLLVFSSGAFGCIFSSWALALGSWALALGSRAISSAVWSYSLQPEPLWGFSSAVLGFSREVLAFRFGGFGFSSYLLDGSSEVLGFSSSEVFGFRL